MLIAEIVQAGTTVNPVTLLLIRADIKTLRPGFLAKGVLLLHDNNRPQRATAARLLMQPFRWEILDHSAYSVVLAPTVKYLFSAKRSFCLPQASKLCRSVENYDAAVAIARQALLSTGNREALSVK